MSSYQRFAHVYDQIGSDRFSVKMFTYTQRLLVKMKYRPRSVCDIACGTGTAAVMWAKQRLKTYAIDGSEDMLEMAREKADIEQVDIKFSHQNLTVFALPEPVDLVTCYFDSLNYLLTLGQIQKCFRCTHDILKPGGLFIFDVNTPEAMKVLWDSQTYADETDSVAWIWKNQYFPKAKQAEIHATFFVRQGDMWERFEEIHAERGYTTTEMKKELTKTGFTTKLVYDCLSFRKPDRKSLRLAIVAQKRSR